EELLGRPVQTVGAVVGPEVQKAAEKLQPGDVLLLENTRFHEGEKRNDAELSRQLADLADVYVDDAFGSAHRAHASTEGAARAMQAKGGAAVAGYLMGKEIAALGRAATNPPHPYVAIMGGAKISDKIKLIDNLLEKADTILIGGGMANTFLAAKGHELGQSLVEDEALPEARRLLATAGARLVLPVDVVIAGEMSADAEAEIRPVEDIPATKMALDIGPETIELFKTKVQDAALVVWNGPMGVFEIERFAEGTNQLAKALARLAAEGTEVVIGGGDSAAAVQQAGLADQMSHVSTGGGASLEMLQGDELPGIAVLDEAA
ncbi:MAG: phosphoglycerate kinase, partial [Anaerolineae bacterium]|nr:phosphoglycerate kinase [Anaerolineae bacterium]